MSVHTCSVDESPHASQRRAQRRMKRIPDLGFTQALTVVYTVQGLRLGSQWHSRRIMRPMIGYSMGGNPFKCARSSSGQTALMIRLAFDLLAAGYIFQSVCLGSAVLTSAHEAKMALENEANALKYEQGASKSSRPCNCRQRSVAPLQAARLAAPRRHLVRQEARGMRLRPESPRRRAPRRRLRP